MSEHSKQRIDADKAFFKTQSQSSLRNRIISETESADQARDAKTARLRAERLAKEALDRDRRAADPPKQKKRQPASR